MSKKFDEKLPNDERYRRQLKFSHGYSLDEVDDRIQDIKEKNREDYEKGIKNWEKKQQNLGENKNGSSG